MWAGDLPECIPGVQRPAGLRGRLGRGGELLCALPAVLRSSLLPLAPGPRECQQSCSAYPATLPWSSCRTEPHVSPGGDPDDPFPHSGAGVTQAIGWPRTVCPAWT